MSVHAKARKDRREVIREPQRGVGVVLFDICFGGCLGIGAPVTQVVVLFEFKDYRTKTKMPSILVFGNDRSGAFNSNGGLCAPWLSKNNYWMEKSNFL